jgi:hypothetical protein
MKNSGMAINCSNSSVTVTDIDNISFNRYQGGCHYDSDYGGGNPKFQVHALRYIILRVEFR